MMLFNTILYRLPISSMTSIFMVMSKRLMSFIFNSGHLSKEEPHSKCNGKILPQELTITASVLGGDLCFCLGSKQNPEPSIYRANCPFQPLWQL